MDANNLSQAKTQLDNLELSFSRIDALYQTGGVSKAEWDAQNGSWSRSYFIRKLIDEHAIIKSY